MLRYCYLYPFPDPDFQRVAGSRGPRGLRYPVPGVPQAVRRRRSGWAAHLRLLPGAGEQAGPAEPTPPSYRDFPDPPQAMLLSAS